MLVWGLWFSGCDLVKTTGWRGKQQKQGEEKDVRTRMVHGTICNMRPCQCNIGAKNKPTMNKTIYHIIRGSDFTTPIFYFVYNLL